MARNLSTAILRSASGAVVIDGEAGVIRGVKLMELGVTARFASEEGPKSVKITDAHISALLSHAGNRSIPIHDSHEWFDAQGKPNADSVEMNARIGALKSFRRDDFGNLIADAYLNKAKPAALDLLWGAEANPEDNCFSVVFSYLKDDPNCIPQNFRAGDRVPSGAATTALFSEDKTTAPSMDIAELIAALDDPKVKTALKAILKSHEDPADAAAEDSAAATMEADSGVTDADKKPDDEQTPALMRAAIRCERARNRKFNEQKTALLSEMETKIKASETALLGRGKFLPAGDEKKDADTYTATLSTYKEASKGNEVLAVARMLKDKPELLGEYEKRQRDRCAKLTGVPAQ